MPRSLRTLTYSTPIGEQSLLQLNVDADPIAVFCELVDVETAFFLDSTASRFGKLSEWSFLGIEPDCMLEIVGSQAKLSGQVTSNSSDAKAALPAFLPPLSDTAQVVGRDQPPLQSGVIGYLGYELGGLFEKLPTWPAGEGDFPDAWLGHFAQLLAYRHSDHSWWLSCGSDRDPEICDRLREAVERASGRAPELEIGHDFGVAERGWNCDRAGYQAKVESIQEHIRAGDIYQANLCRRFDADCSQLDPTKFYCALRAANPAPFSAALRIGSKGIFSSSPERFIRVSGRQIETRPIKGTAPRGRDAGADRHFAAELLASEKDAAELAMIVDVLRNDLGRICDYGTMAVEDHRSLESYAAVHHLVSTVKGRLRDGVDAYSVLEAVFPGGSITGAPKIKAIEVLAGLEQFRRGVYTGVIGYFADSGNIDLNIAIRTVTLESNRLSFGVGGGIVFDSTPERELDETLHKARAIFDALGIEVQS